MKIKPGFDRKHRRPYIGTLCAIALASSLILVADISGLDSEKETGFLSLFAPALSLIFSTASYLHVRRIDRSFHLVGMSAFIFSGALWTFGAPMPLTLLLAISSMLVTFISLAFGEIIDKDVESDG